MMNNSSDADLFPQAASAAEAGDGSVGSPVWYIQNFCLLLVTLVTIVGNGFIIALITTHRTLQRPSHVFIASLASTDLLLGVTVMAPRLSQVLLGRWVFGFFLCQTYHAMDVTLSTASILHLSCVSLDRYFAIVNQPLLYNQRMTPTRVTLMIALCWILSSLTGFLPVFSGLYSSREHLELARLHPEECDFAVNKYFSVLAGLVSFWLPGAIMIFVYVKVYRETQRLQKQLQNLNISLRDMKSPNRGHRQSLLKPDGARNDDDDPEEASGSGTGAAAKEDVHMHHERESRAALTVGIVIGIFLICWLPFFIWMPLTALLELETPPVVYSIILWVGYGNSVVNPFIYGFFSREFRTVILADLRRAKGAHNAAVYSHAGATGGGATTAVAAVTTAAGVTTTTTALASAASIGIDS